MTNEIAEQEKDCYVVWENCLRTIRENTTPEAFMTWFEPIIPHNLIGDVLVIQVPSHFFYEYLEANFIKLMRKAIDLAIGDTGRLEYFIVETQVPDQLPNNFLKPNNYNNGQFKNNNYNNSNYNNNNSNYNNNNNNNIQNPYLLSKEMYEFQKTQYATALNKFYSFDNFIEGDCNRLARSTGFAVAQRPGVTAFNPLMLYGGVGLGKTHLVQAIGNHINEHYPNREVVYVSADRFTDQLIDALKNNRGDMFKQFYMQLDVLMIDDVQFLANKEKTQEIFFSIFNHLHLSGKQIIMTSDRPPVELTGLEDRLLTRFKWGLTTDLKQPDLETRMAIIYRKLQERNQTLPDTIIEYLVHSIDSNVRELEGAINSLTGLSEHGILIDMDVAKQTVEQIVQFTESKQVGIAELQRHVADYFNITVDDLKDKTRKKEIVIARQIAMYFAKEHTGFSLKSIGYHFGGRDHSTVIHAIQAVTDMIQEKREIRIYVEDIDRKLRGK